MNEKPLVFPADILRELGLFERNVEVPKLTERAMEEFQRRTKAFDWVHLGTTDLPIGKLVEVIRRSPNLLPPRTGHMGNWEDIARGRAGTVDYNKAICAERNLGYPLVYTFNQTEDEALAQGDWIYLPGSLVENGKRRVLPLFTWDGARFVERSRVEPLFTPFVHTPVDGKLVSITRFHWERMLKMNGFSFRLEASVIRENEELVRELLYVLLEEAARHENQQRALADLLSHTVSLDGRVRRSPISFDGQGYRMGDVSFSSTAELVNAAMLPFVAATEPETFFAGIADLPNEMPVVSNHLTSLVSALLHTHYPGVTVDRPGMSQPCNPHLHWGALGMAGYPPEKLGYFAEKSTVKTAKRIYQTAISHFAQLDPVFFVLIPVSPYTLCPTSSHPRDLELVADLIRQVKEATDSLAGRPDLMPTAVGKTVEGWLPRVRNRLSAYYLNRFSNRRSVLNEVDLPDYSETVEPPGFEALTMRQGCNIVGALTKLLGQQ